MSEGFKLDASKHIDNKKTKIAETWGLEDKNEESLLEKTFTQNVGQAFDIWETNAQETEDMELALQTLASRTALQEEELNANKAKEIEAMRLKAQIKNWSEDKLADKIEKVEQKYEKLQQKRIALGEKEEQRIRKKNEAAHQKILNAKVKNIDNLLDQQEDNALTEINLKSTSHNAYDEPKTAEDKLNKLCLSLYSGDYYEDINRYLRTGKDVWVKFQNKKIRTSKLVQRVYRGVEMFNLKRDVAVTRNSNFRSLLRFLGMTDNPDIKKADDLIKVLKEKPMNGHIGFDKGFFSTTIVKGGIEDSFAEMQVEYRIFTPKGTGCTYLATFSEYKGEKELLMQAGTAFRMVKIKTSGSWKGDGDGQESGKKIKDKKIIVYLEAIQKNKEKKGSGKS